MTSPCKVRCPYCPGSPKHRDVAHRGVDASSVPGSSVDTRTYTSAPASSDVTQAQQTRSGLHNLPSLKRQVRVLRHIPKGARKVAAGRLSHLIEECLRSNDVEDWFNLLSFPFSALRAVRLLLSDSSLALGYDDMTFM